MEDAKNNGHMRTVGSVSSKAAIATALAVPVLMWHIERLTKSHTMPSKNAEHPLGQSVITVGQASIKAKQAKATRSISFMICAA